MRDTKSALLWITDILKTLEVSFQITGGLAAQSYGSTRGLADIDIDIPEDSFELVKKNVEKYIVLGPANHRDDKWDLLLMCLNYKGQDIDLSGAYKAKIFNAVNNQWQNLETDLEKAVIRIIFGLPLPTIPIKDLIEYKKILARDVDLIDVQEISD